jgi:hypothetical protein
MICGSCRKHVETVADFLAHRRTGECVRRRLRLAPAARLVCRDVPKAAPRQSCTLNANPAPLAGGSGEDMRWAGMCPRFDRCNVNRCPLDPLLNLRPDNRADLAHTCRAPLRVRLEIASRAEAAGATLAHAGLTDAEARSGRPLAELLAHSDAATERKRKKGLWLAEMKRRREQP